MTKRRDWAAEHAAATRMVVTLANRHNCTGRDCTHPNHAADVEAARTVLYTLGLLEDPNPGQSQCGTPTAYKQGCRCVSCRRAWNDYMREYMRDRRAAQRGEKKLVSAEPVRLHIAELRATGMTYRELSELTGISENTLHKLGSDQEWRIKYTSPDKARSILAIPIEKAV